LKSQESAAAGSHLI